MASVYMKNPSATRIISNTPRLLRRITRARTLGMVHLTPWMGVVLYKVRSGCSHLYLTLIADVTSAADQVAIYRGWLESQVDAQKARIKAMSEQFSIPVPDFELNPFEAPPLSLMTPSMGKAVATTTNKTMMPQESKKKYVFDERDEPSAPPAPRKPSVMPVLGLWKPEAQESSRTARTIAPGPPSARSPMPPRPSPLDQGPNPGTPNVVVSEHRQASNAPKKGDMAYKTTPCRHYTLSQGWCPYGDECGL